MDLAASIHCLVLDIEEQELDIAEQVLDIEELEQHKLAVLVHSFESLNKILMNLMNLQASLKNCR
jgi:hypothetical protein